MSIDPAAILAAAAEDAAESDVPQPPRIDTDRPYTTAYTDGSSTGGWGPGGWAWCVLDPIEPFGGPREDSGGSGWTTNQRMELTAAHEAMKANPGLLLIVSDSEYVVKGFTEWARGWWRRDFHKVSNADLWRPAIETYLARGGPRGEVRFAWHKGHAGLPGNVRADLLCGQARDAVPFADWGPKHDPEAYARYIAPGGMSAIGKALNR